jgi:hypothetical protein
MFSLFGKTTSLILISETYNLFVNIFVPKVVIESSNEINV